MTNEQMYFNGINGASGRYEMPAMSLEELANCLVGQVAPENLQELKHRYEQKDEQHFGVKDGIDGTNLAEAGWGIIFPHDIEPEILEALTPLITLRKEQAGEYFRIFDGPDAHRPGESKTQFLARHKVGPGPADPQKMPYYLLIVGSPERIPFLFQFQLDVQYAVGRLHFERIEDYANYAAAVVAAESGEMVAPQKLGFFGVANPDDPATNLSLRNLLHPMMTWAEKEHPKWEIQAVLGEQAKKQELLNMMTGPERPAILFSASHGMSFPNGDPRQLVHQGALLCGDWPGPKNWGSQGAIPQDYYLAGDDLSDSPSGMISFHFACYGAGVPRYDEFSRKAFKTKQILAEKPFVANLPQQMLGHGKGAALAVIGHVDRAWGYSFNWPGAGAQTAVFESTLAALLAGKPVGYALDYFNLRYAELATLLTAELEDIEFGVEVDPQHLSGLWTAHNDARDYVVLGDPAVRVPYKQGLKTWQHTSTHQSAHDFVSDNHPLVLPQEQSSPVTNAKENNLTPELKTNQDHLRDQSSKQPNPEEQQIKMPEKEPEEKTMSDESNKEIPYDPAEIDYGLRDMSRKMMDSLKDMSGNLADKLSEAARDLGTLEVSTYVAEDLEKVNRKPGDLEAQARLHAYTRISLDGDMTNLVPVKPAEKGASTRLDVDKELWKIHQESVQQAQQNRVEMYKAIGEIMARLVRGGF